MTSISSEVNVTYDYYFRLSFKHGKDLCKATTLKSTIFKGIIKETLNIVDEGGFTLSDRIFYSLFLLSVNPNVVPMLGLLLT